MTKEQQTAAMRQALEALERLWADGFEGYSALLHEQAITALRQALEQRPADEPFCYHDGRNIVEKQFANDSDVFPLYTRPQPAAWVELTEQGIYSEGGKHEKFAKNGNEWFDRGSFARAIEAKLKEKNT